MRSSTAMTAQDLSENQQQSVSGINDESGFRRYFGKYKGTVVNTLDPKNEGRVLVSVPEISAAPLLNWATVVTPIGGLQHGLFAPLMLNTKVYVEFESGDPDYPIVTGCIRQAASEVPRKAPPVNPMFNSLTLQTPLQHGLVITDLPGPSGGIQITTPLQQKITLTNLGIELNNGMGASIKLIGPTIQIEAAQVNVNNGALTIV